MTIALLCTVPSGAPQTLTVVGTGVTTISLSWQQPAPETRNGLILGYSVRISSVSSAETREITTVNTNLTVTSLAPYTLYECVVAAYTSVGAGPPSDIILAQTEPTSKILYSNNLKDILYTLNLMQIQVALHLTLVG